MTDLVVTRIRDFLSGVDDTSQSESDSIDALIAALDGLAVSIHAVRFESDETDYPEPPTQDHKATWQRVAARFPKFGYYNSPLDISEKIAETTLAVGDAVGDVAEIYDDLQEVLWRFENTSQADALFHFQLGFRTHWGRHLRELQLYAHDLHW